MKPLIKCSISIFLLIVFTLSPIFATCGGGGGGGGGGTSSGGPATDANPQVYHVPWRIRDKKDAAAGGLILYWFPATSDEIRKSSLRESRALSLYAAQCISMELADTNTPGGAKLIGDSKLPVAVLTNPDGTPVERLENKAGRLNVSDVEKLVGNEVKKREDTLDANLKSAREKLKAGNNPEAIQILRAVAEQKCMFPKMAKDASKELKKLGVGDVAEVPAGPVFEPKASARIERAMVSGLKAENAGKYEAAKGFYNQARRMDPADPTPLRYLGELYRHHTGEWEEARSMFNAILEMPSDPLSRAVAQHGLGKMTIHDGDFKKGLALMEASIVTFPLTLTYRNLVVYWNSEGDAAKTEYYIKKAIALDPTEPYNLVFSAAFLAGTGHGDEALKIARKYESLLPASYNLAAVYAQTGNRDKALALLKRHFFKYERFQAVRTKEMMEARVDAVFASLQNDAGFAALTSGADGKLPVPDRSKRKMPGMNN